MEKKRVIFYYKNYFLDFYSLQTSKVRDKIQWTFDLIEYIDIVPEQYLKHPFGYGWTL